MTSLHTLVERLEDAGIVRRRTEDFDNVMIDHLANDSRKVSRNGLFVAISGVQADGHTFIDKAVINGAIAVVCEAMPENHEVRFPGIAFVHVTNSRTALALLGAAFFGDPSKEITTIGVTGTNGKTTVSFLIHHALSRFGRRSGLIGTVEIRIADRKVETNLTTPDALEIQHLFHSMKKAGCTDCIMEVSSHALDQERVAAVDFDAAVFTNLSRDHLDYHGTAEAYLAAKKKLFDGLASDASAVYNLDDPAGPAIVADSEAATTSYGLSREATVRGEIVENNIDGLRLRLDGRLRRFQLVGRFNAYNLAAAYTALTSLGHDRTETIEALASAPPVPGRFELIKSDSGKTAVVDYAHTPDALENVLQTIQETKNEESTLWCVFGCGGDRDREKRPMMGAVAERLADRIIVTSDNPRTENPSDIMNDIRGGMTDFSKAAFVVDRKSAIRAAVSESARGDIILVAGKGHEAYQLVGTDKLPFDDRTVIREAFDTVVP